MQERLLRRVLYTSPLPLKKPLWFLDAKTLDKEFEVPALVGILLEVVG